MAVVLLTNFNGIGWHAGVIEEACTSETCKHPFRFLFQWSGT